MKEEINSWFDERFGSAPVFLNNEAKKIWDKADLKVRNEMTRNISQWSSYMSSKVAIEILCCIIEDLVKRIEKIENEK